MRLAQEVTEKVQPNLAAGGLQVSALLLSLN
jgi:hypothetical protein